MLLGLGDPREQFLRIAQLPGFVGETLQQRGGLVECLAVWRDAAALGRFRQRLDVKRAGEMLVESEVGGTFRLGIVVLRQRRFERF